MMMIKMMMMMNKDPDRWASTALYTCLLLCINNVNK